MIPRNDREQGLAPINMCNEVARCDRMAKYIYDIQNNNVNITDSKRQRWERQLHEAIPRDQYLKAMMRIYTITSQSKLQSFQFVLMHGNINTDRDVLKYKISTDQHFVKEKMSTCVTYFGNVKKSKDFLCKLFHWLRS